MNFWDVGKTDLEKQIPCYQWLETQEEYELETKIYKNIDNTE